VRQHTRRRERRHSDGPLSPGDFRRKRNFVEESFGFVLVWCPRQVPARSPGSGGPWPACASHRADRPALAVAAPQVRETHPQRPCWTSTRKRSFSTFASCNGRGPVGRASSVVRGPWRISKDALETVLPDHIARTPTYSAFVRRARGTGEVALSEPFRTRYIRSSPLITRGSRWPQSVQPRGGGRRQFSPTLETSMRGFPLPLRKG